MKPATEKKVKEIAARAKNLQTCYVREIRALGNENAKPEDTEVPRVSGIVIREGLWLLKIADKFIARHNIALDEKKTNTILEAKEFFDKLADEHSDEVSKNDFIFRLPAEFILHLSRVAALVQKFDADVKAKIAAVAVEEEEDDAALQDEIDAEMIG